MYTPIDNYSRSYGNNRWFGYSPKLKRNVWTYSNLEYDHWVLVEMDPDVVTFCEQPLRITTGEHEAIFDMWLRRRDGSEEFREVKYSAALDPTTGNTDIRSIQEVLARFAVESCQFGMWDEILSHAKRPWRLFHVRGSTAYLHPEQPQVPMSCLYRQVILGFVLEGDRSRWLTHEEVCGGVIRAMQRDAERTVVGTLEPWDQRPE